MTTLPRLISDCQGKIDRGSCSTPIQMWAYDKKKGRCLPFTYGGCGGNLNRFFSRDQCQQTCEETSISTTKTTEKSLSVTTTSELKYVIKTKSACLRPRVRISKRLSKNRTEILSLYSKVGSSVKCGQGVKLSKFYFYNASSRKCQGEIGCPVPLDDTSRGNRFFSKISCLKLCSDTYNHDCRYSSLQKRKATLTFNSFYCSGCPKTLVRLACINNGTPDTPMTKYRISAVPSITLDARGTATISTHFMLANILVLPCFPPTPVITPQLGGSQTT